MTTHPPGGLAAASSSAAKGPGEILEETITVKVYSWRCDKCQRTLHHRDRRTLEHNIDEHRVQRHSLEAHRRKGLEQIKRQVGKLQKHLNRRYGV